MDKMTLSYVMAASNLIIAIVMMYIWWNNKKTAGVFYWSISWVVSTLAFAVALLIPVIGNYAIVVNNTLAYLAVICIFEGTIRYKSIRINQQRNKFYILILLYFFITSLLNRNLAEMRYLMNDPVAAILFVSIAIVMVLNTQEEKKIIYYFLSALSLVYAFGFILRFIAALNGEIVATNNMHFSVVFIYFIGIVYSFVFSLGVLLILQEKYASMLSNMAFYDNMTNLLNRRSFDMRLDEIVDSFDLKKDIYHLTLIDIDQFKHINDSYGHVVGDEVIIETAERLTKYIGDKYVYRIGGDEFAVLSEKNYEPLIRKIFREPYYLKNMQLDIKGSVGTSQLKKERIESNHLYKLADEQMYKDKTNNRKWY